MTCDVAVVGLGAMGSAIAAHCAARGASVIGLEQFAPLHELGSSTGKSRMIRKAYFEDPAYVPLLLRSYDLWRDLERRREEKLLQITGLLMVGHENSEIIQGALRSAKEHDLAIEFLNQQEIQSRYPTLRVLGGEVGVCEPDGGVLVPEKAIRAHLDWARTSGAELRFEVEMKQWRAGAEGFDLSLGDGTRISARVLVLALGAWFKKALEALDVPIRVQRNVQAWFTPATSAYLADRFPPFLLDRAELPAPLYGFPDFGEGVKAAFHAHGALTDAREVEREISFANDIAPIITAMEQWMPGAVTTFRLAKTCLYTLTPDSHFVIDRHPEHRDLILCGGFSGHGFKFAPVMGEIVSDLALEGFSRHRIDFLSLRRFA